MDSSQQYLLTVTCHQLFQHWTAHPVAKRQIYIKNRLPKERMLNMKGQQNVPKSQTNVYKKDRFPTERMLNMKRQQNVRSTHELPSKFP
jgi:hypothetical protein